VVVVDLPDRGTGDLRASARRWRRRCDRTGAARVDLVGYSAGGVVIRLWLADPGRALRARRVVLLGTPNHGTELAGAAAALGPGLCAASASSLPARALLAELNRGDETPPGPRFFSIWTAQDQTVDPAGHGRPGRRGQHPGPGRAAPRPASATATWSPAPSPSAWWLEALRRNPAPTHPAPPTAPPSAPPAPRSPAAPG
jgi:hypothetical protein